MEKGGKKGGMRTATKRKKIRLKGKRRRKGEGDCGERSASNALACSSINFTSLHTQKMAQIPVPEGAAAEVLTPKKKLKKKVPATGAGEDAGALGMSMHLLFTFFHFRSFFPL